MQFYALSLSRLDVRRLWNETKSKLKLNGHASTIAHAARMAVHALQYCADDGGVISSAIPAGYAAP
jgi:hypothetical protein